MVPPQIVDFLKTVHSFVTSFGLIDFALTLLVLVGLLRGYHKGFSALFGQLVQLVFIILVTVEYTDRIRGFLPISSPAISVIAHLVIFLTLVFLCYRISKLVKQGIAKVLTIHFSEVIEKVGGALFGVAFFVLLLSFVSYFLLLFPGNWVRESYEKYNLSGSFMIQLAPEVHKFVRQAIPESLRAAA
ncbi:MAG: CvpA family protein [Candidatus Omnitrophica bacterium]|nr:CvpA family protein [Candidatus Omnitrophota bacterium]